MEEPRANTVRPYELEGNCNIFCYLRLLPLFRMSVL